eukprot:scaffold17260_cov86-Cyclotella_meneghiniana.AAC.3
MIQSSDEDAEALHLRHNAWDTELGCYMSAAEKQCTRRRNDMIEFSPMVNTVLHRKRIYQWALRKKKGHRVNVGSLKRAAKVWKVDNPLDLSTQELESRLHGLEVELNVLRHNSKQLRWQHLLDCLRRARDDGDEDDVHEIKRIMKRESDKEKQKRINFAVRPPQGRSVTQVQLNDPKTTPTSEADFRTEEEDIIKECNARLSQRFSLGKRAAISHGKLLEDLGNLGDTAAARRILEGTYEFPENADPATVLLLKELARMALEMEGENDDGWLTVPEFQDYWKKAKERTSSSYSGRHFGHYKAASKDDFLSALHTGNINLATHRGRPLDRWRKGVTVLLEKEPGNCFIDKLRAILLLEGDLNQFLKEVFA